MKLEILKFLSTCFPDFSLSESDVVNGGGVRMAKVLNRIDQEHFDQQWVEQKVGHVPGDSKRIKANNLKKILAAIMEYYAEVRESKGIQSVFSGAGKQRDKREKIEEKEKG